jgi:two-component system response regulator RegA
VLLVDDDVAFCRSFQRGAPGHDIDLTVAHDPEEAIADAKGFQPDVALVDIHLGDASGVEVIRSISEQVPLTRIVALSGASAPNVVVEAIKAGAVDYLVKPLDLTQVATFVQSLCTRRDETRTLYQAKCQHIQKVLAQSGGNVSEAARRLGLPRASLQRMLRKMGLRKKHEEDES